MKALSAWNCGNMIAWTDLISERGSYFPRIFMPQIFSIGVSLIRPYSCNTRILPYPAVSCRILPYPAVSCRILPYPAVSCRILPYPAVSAGYCRLLLSPPYPAV